MEKKQLMKRISLGVMLCMLLNIILFHLPFVHWDNTANAASLPDGWTAIDIGGSGGSSSYDAGTGTFTITGSGNGGESSSADSLYYVYTAVNAANKEISVTARVTSVKDAGVNTRVGPMIRADVDADTQIGAAYTTGTGTRYFSRFWNNAADANATSSGVGTLPGTGISSESTPFGDSYLMKIVKDSSNRYRAWYSTDGGKNWTAPGGVKAQATTDTTAPMLVGLAVGTSATVTIDHVTINNSPSRLRATAGDTDVKLEWDPVGGADSYKVMMSTSPGGPYSEVRNSITETSYTWTGLTNNSSYYFVVAANLNYYEVNNSKTITGTSENSQQATATPMAMPPAAPTGLTASAGNGEAVLNWTSVPNATAYSVKMSTEAGGPYTALNDNITDASFTATGLANGTTYYFVLSASNNSGEGPDSSEVSVTPKALPSAPMTPLLEYGDQYITIHWLPVAGADYYTVKTSTGQIIATNLTGSSYTITGLTNGTEYSYKVSATGVAGQGSDSSTVKASPVANPAAISVPNASVVYDLLVYDTVNSPSWSVVPSGPELGGMIYGDRTTGQFNFAGFPEKYATMEHLVTAGNSKSFGGDKTAVFKLKEDAFVYAGFDDRIVGIPQWAASWEKTNDVITSSDVSGNSLSYTIYRKFFEAGSTVQLGANGQSNGVIHYFAFIEPLPKVFEMEPVQQWVNVPAFQLSLIFIEDLTNVTITQNGNTIMESTSVAADIPFDQTVSLAEGTNTFEIHYTRSNGLSGYKMFTMVYDTANPVIAMTSTPDNKVSDAAFKLAGAVNEDAYITVKLNGQGVASSLFTGKDAAFEQQLAFTDGYNLVELFVKDKAGNETSVSYDVWYSPLAIDNVTFKDLSGNLVTGLEASISLAASTEVTNKDIVSRNVQLIVVLYDGNNQVELYSTASKLLAAGETKVLNAGFKLPVDITGYKVKVLIWDSMKNMKPLETEIELK